MAKSKSQDSKGLAALDKSPSHLLHRALQLALDIYADEQGEGGVTQRQYAVLAAVEAYEGLTQTDLVKITGIDRSTLADLVTRMTAKGLLERERSTLDARAKAVRLSPDGEAALLAARPRVEAADKRIMALLPKGQRETFLNQLADLAAAADAATDAAKAEAKAAKKALKAVEKEARKAEKAAKKADRPAKPAKIKKPKLKLVEPA